MEQYAAFHGTCSDSAESIVETQEFFDSRELDEWLGDGVYFFVEGISDPVANAMEWVENNSRKLCGSRIEECVVLQAQVSGERVLDLREEEGKQMLHRLRDVILRRYKKEEEHKRFPMHPDTFMANAMVESMKLDIMIEDFPFPLGHYSGKLWSRVPNVTVLCAKKTATISDIEEIRRKKCP